MLYGVMLVSAIQQSESVMPLLSCLISSVLSDSLRPHGLQPAKLLYPWGFSRQEYWSGLPCPLPGDLPNPGIEPESLMSPALASEFFTTSATREALKSVIHRHVPSLWYHLPTPSYLSGYFTFIYF